VECVWHGARFDCLSGAVNKGPAVDPVPMYDVRVEAGKILVGPRRSASKEAAR
jgi:nitrite reductase/ring-hydroxylating ferredoxin subunit